MKSAQSGPPPLPQGPPSHPAPLPDIGKMAVLPTPQRASMIWRSLAFGLDVVLVSLVALLILDKFVWPNFFPGAVEEFQEFVLKSSAAYEAALQTGVAVPQPDPPSGEVVEMVQTSQLLVLFSFWLYFLATESFLGGASMGKRIFRLRVVLPEPMTPPGFFEGSLRAALKTLSLLMFPLMPILLINLSVAFFNRRRQTGHDLLCRTLVINDNTPDPRPAAT